MRIVHLTASTSFGGPERQMLGLAHALPADCESHFLLFPEGGRGQAFLDQARRQGFDAAELGADTPRLWAAVREIADRLRELRTHVLLCHGYKADLLGRRAARRAGVAAVAVSRGWTGEDRKVRVYEWLDRRELRRFDRVVCVSDGQAVKVRRCGVPPEKLTVIRNAARAELLRPADAAASRARLLNLLPAPARDTRIVLAAGRLSPEKGVDVLVEAARRVGDSRACFIICGDGAERAALGRQIAAAGLVGRVVLAGFRGDLDELMPGADLFVLPSRTEGLPNVALEASARGVAVVATAVGGTPEVVAHGVNGLLVPPGDPAALAGRIAELLADDIHRAALGAAGRDRMRREFTFAAQAEQYLELFAELGKSSPARRPVAVGGAA